MDQSEQLIQGQAEDDLNLLENLFDLLWQAVVSWCDRANEPALLTAIHALLYIQSMCRPDFEIKNQDEANERDAILHDAIAAHDILANGKTPIITPGCEVVQ